MGVSIVFGSCLDTGASRCSVSKVREVLQRLNICRKVKRSKHCGCRSIRATAPVCCVFLEHEALFLVCLSAFSSCILVSISAA